MEQNSSKVAQSMPLCWLLKENAQKSKDEATDSDFHATKISFHEF